MNPMAWPASAVHWTMTTLQGRPTLAQFRVFLAVARAGAFSEAAAKLGMSQSSLSEGVAGLERSLGKRLLLRSAAGVTLIPTGERVLEHAARAVQASDDLLLSAQDEEGLSGTLTVAAYRSLGVHLLPAALAEVSARFPRLEVRVLNAEADGQSGVGLMLSRQADAGLIVASDAPLLSYPLLQDEYVVVLPAGGEGRPLDWADLQGQTLLMPTASDTCTRLVLSYLRERQITPRSVMEFAEDDVIYSMVARGLGVAIQPWLSTTPLRGDLRVQRFASSFTRSLVVVTLPGRASLPHIAAFVSAVRRAAADLLGGGLSGRPSPLLSESGSAHPGQPSPS